MLAAPEALRPLAELSAAVDAIYPTNSLEEFRTPEGPVDIAVNLHGKGPAGTLAVPGPPAP